MPTPDTASPGDTTPTVITRRHIRATAATHLYVFGDNLQACGLGGQAAAARGEPNAYGVPTKKAPTMRPDAFFSDHEFAANCAAIRTALACIPRDGRTVVAMPGIGEGRAELSRRAPRTYAFLRTALADLITSRTASAPAAAAAE